MFDHKRKYRLHALLAILALLSVPIIVACGPAQQAGPATSSGTTGQTQPTTAPTAGAAAVPTDEGTAASEAATGQPGAAGTESPAAEDAEQIGDLLETAEHEYEEAVKGGKIVKMEEYQEAREAFLSAQKLYQPIAGQVRAANAEAGEEIDHEMEELAEIFAEEQPSNAPATPEKVKEAVGETRAELAKALNLEVGGPKDPQARVAEIREMVEHSLEEYREGEKEEAYELAANSYLQGFEHVDGDLLEKGQRELVEDLELDFKALRDAIKAGKPVSQIEPIASEINQGLDKSLEALK